MASLFRRNVLLAFEKLQQHTAEWLIYRNVDVGMKESMLQLFYKLLLERWTEFMENTEKYTDPDAWTKRARKDNDEATGDDTVVSLSNGQGTVGKNPSTPSSALPTTIEFQACNHGQDEDDHDADACSIITTPMPDTLDASNSLRSDATQGLYRAIANGAGNVNELDDDHYDNDNVSLIQSWLSKGALVASARYVFGETAHHRAAATGQVAALQRLRLWGANPWERSNWCELALYVSCWHGHVQSCQVLWQHLLGPVAAANSRSVCCTQLVDDRGRIPLHYACWGAMVEDEEENEEEENDDADFNPTNAQDARVKGRMGLWHWIVEFNYDIYDDIYDDEDDDVQVGNGVSKNNDDGESPPQSGMESLSLVSSPCSMGPIL